MKEKLLKFITISLFIVSVIYTFYLNSTEKEIGLAILINLFLLALVIGFNFKKPFNYFKQNQPKKSPETAGMDVMGKIIYKTIEGTPEQDYKDGYFVNVAGIEDIKRKTIESQLIYAFRVNLSFKISFDKLENKSLWVIINSTYPKQTPQVISGVYSFNSGTLENAMNQMSTDFKEKDKEINEITDPITGRISRTEKTIAQKEEKEEEKELV